ncbi:PadR family transcriptional regulator [Nakamurella deserti]|uniref:PadR family transcriptional regulator n=1 Tax=Nakamurella deserti TaxID=2164074 RepID=UPI00197C7C12|nr:PadR family transcriptional regulator [Nakamurella deserti]
MPLLNPLALATLGVLVERPMHPYEMFQLLIDRSEDRLVKVRRGTLYHAVARLTETGLTEVVGTDRGGNRPERTTYAITAAGRTVLDDTVRDQLARPEPDYPMFPLALAQAHNLPREDVVAALHRRIDGLAAELAGYDSGIAAAAARGVPRRYLVDADYQRTMRHTELDWLRRFVAELTDDTIPWHPPGAAGPYPDATSAHTPLENAGSPA